MKIKHIYPSYAGLQPEGLLKQLRRSYIRTNLSLKGIVGTFILGLFIVNVVLFARSIVLSDSIAKIEAETNKIALENKELEKKVYSMNSLNSLDKIAANLGFTKKAEPLYLKTLQFAQAKQ